MRAIDVTCRRVAEDGRPYWTRTGGRPACSAPGDELVHPECLLAALGEAGARVTIPWPRMTGTMVLGDRPIVVRFGEVTWAGTIDDAEREPDGVGHARVTIVAKADHGQ